MSNSRLFLILACVSSVVTGCATATKKPDYDYAAFREADPRSVLIVPAVNRSVQVDAPDFFLATITRPAAERGYYVYPVHMVKRLLEDDGLSDADMVHSADTVRLAELFGADSVLYVSIEQWNAKYVFVSTTVTVEFDYLLTDGKTGEELWRSRESRVYTPSSSSTGNAIADLIAGAVTAAATKAAPNYVPLSTQANQEAVTEAHHGVPAGPYHADYKKDLDLF